MYVKEKGPVRTKNWSGKLSFGGITAPAFAKVLEESRSDNKKEPLVQSCSQQSAPARGSAVGRMLARTL